MVLRISLVINMNYQELLVTLKGNKDDWNATLLKNLENFLADEHKPEGQKKELEKYVKQVSDKIKYDAFTKIVKNAVANFKKKGKNITENDCTITLNQLNSTKKTTEELFPSIIEYTKEDLDKEIDEIENTCKKIKNKGKTKTDDINIYDVSKRHYYSNFSGHDKYNVYKDVVVGTVPPIKREISLKLFLYSLIIFSIISVGIVTLIWLIGIPFAYVKGLKNKAPNPYRAAFYSWIYYVAVVTG